MLEQLIVLGQVPGTQIQLNFFQTLTVIMSVGFVVYAQHELRKVHTKDTTQTTQITQ